MSNLRTLFLRHLGQTSPSPMLVEVESAKGSRLFGPDGQDYIDLVAGVSVCNLGHGHPKVLEALHQQADRHLHVMVYGDFVQSPQVRLASRLAELLPPTLDSVYFVNSGSEAIEGAIKLAKRHTRRPGLVSMRKAYHGSSNGALSLMGDERFKRAFRPLLPGTRLLDYNDFGQLERIDHRTACVVVEPLQAEAGAILPAPGYLQALRQRCDQVGALLVFDEIQMAFGRMGTLWGFERSGVVPDILCLGKALGGGLPLGAFVAPRPLMIELSHDPVLGHITTFGGHPLSCATGLAALEALLHERLLDDIDRKARRFLDALPAAPITEIRGTGLFHAIDLGSSAALFRAMELFNHGGGIVTDWFLFDDHSFRFAPPLNITDTELDLAAERVSAVLLKL